MNASKESKRTSRNVVAAARPGAGSSVGGRDRSGGADAALASSPRR